MPGLVQRERARHDRQHADRRRVACCRPTRDVRILAKLERQNPFGSVKDRIAKAMIEDAEKDGRLRPGQTILEPSSGNTGIALAAIAQLKGYPIKILMPESVSIERRQMLEVFGAEIILTPGEEGSQRRRAPGPGAGRRAPRVVLPRTSTATTPTRGRTTRAPARRSGATVPEITHFVAGLGTSGTLMGTGRYLKEQNPDIKVIAVEPPLGERVEGLRNIDEGYIPPVFEQLARLRAARPQARRAAPRVASSGPAGWSTNAACSPASRRARRWPARPRSPSEIDDGHDRVHRLRRRLEVPVDRRLHRRPRRRREPTPRTIIYF